MHPGITRTEAVDARARERAKAAGRSFEEELAILGGRTLNGEVPKASDIANLAAFLASPLSVAINGDAIIAAGGRPGTIIY